jgi:hypothetical protein
VCGDERRCALSGIRGGYGARGNQQGRLGVVLVEIAYVTLTAGIYAGMQQQALVLRRRWLGNAIIVVGVPGLAQGLDWLAHRAVGAAAPARATLAVCCFAAISALFLCTSCATEPSSAAAVARW